MCIEAGEYIPSDSTSNLFNCNFYGNEKAGALLSKMMEKGFLEPWPETLKAMTGSSELNVGSIKKFYDPIVKEMQTFINSKKKEEDGLSTAAIVVGIVLGVAVLIVVFGYFIGKKMRKRTSTP